jgi:hypothetical protein
MKTNKHQTLLLAKDKEGIRAKDIVDEFYYSSGTACSYISHLARQGLLEKSGMKYILTERGDLRLRFFDTVGCGLPDCPLCQNKKAGYFTCPRCEHQLTREKARILPEWDFFIGVRRAGVYCPLCQKLLFTEEQAKRLNISKENK